MIGTDKKEMEDTILNINYRIGKLFMKKMDFEELKKIIYRSFSSLDIMHQKETIISTSIPLYIIYLQIYV